MASNDFPGNVDWKRRQGTLVRRVLSALERVSLLLEKPVSRITREHHFNPLYHTGTITVFLLIVISVTGLYLTFFYQFGFEASYEAVTRIEENFVGRLMRALHRYASIAVVLTALLHGWRTFFQDRFRGPRWLAWVSGVVMAVFLWIVGVTGYWLIADERASLITQSLTNLIGGSDWGLRFLFNNIYAETTRSGWVFMVILLTVHIGLTVLMGVFFWLHVKRLSRPKLLPPQYWMIVLGGVLLVAALLLPVGMLPAGDPVNLTGRVPIDLFYLFYLPVGLSDAAVAAFFGAVAMILLAAAVPWLLLRPALEPVQVIDDNCTGCTLCASDCPYRAIEMVPRTDGKVHKFLAQIDPAMCVSCGVCVGSCPPLALQMGQAPPKPLWAETRRRAAHDADRVKIVVTCERHAKHGAARLMPAFTAEDGTHVEVVPVTCVGMAQPDLLTRALDAGADEVQVVGCPAEDCANREGNLWMEERLQRERLPRLRREYTAAPVHFSWEPPNDFARAVRMEGSQSPASAYKVALSDVTWQHFIPAMVLLVIVLAGQIWLSERPFTAYAEEDSMLQILIEHRSGYPVSGSETELDPTAAGAPMRIVATIDDEVVLDTVYTGEDINLGLEQIIVPAGIHRLRVDLYDRADPDQSYTIIDQTAAFLAGKAVILTIDDARLVDGDPIAGRRIYMEQSTGANAGCRICHSLEPGEVLVGPSFAGIATRAGERVPGLSAEEYLRQSILEPDAYVVEGYPAGQMLPNLGEILTEEEIDNLVAFLMTLEEE